MSAPVEHFLRDRFDDLAAELAAEGRRAAHAGAPIGHAGGRAVRRCALCGASLEGRRADARYCSSACRVEAWRLRRLLEGRPVGRYATAADRLAAYGRPRRGRRSQEARESVESSATTQTAGRRANAPGPAPGE